jgi:two-component system, sensor histidine kinase
MGIKIILTRWPFRRKLLLLLLAIFLPAFGIILTNGFNHRKDGIVKAQNQALLLTQSLAAQQEQIAVAAKTMLSTLAQLPEVQDLNSSACNRIFHDLHQRYPFYSSILAMTPDGWVFGAHYYLEPRTVNQADRKYFQDAVSSLDFSAGEYIIGRVSKMTSLNYSFPVLNEHKKLVAVLTAGFNLQEFGRFLSTVKCRKVPPWYF